MSVVIIIIITLIIIIISSSLSSTRSSYSYWINYASLLFNFGLQLLRHVFHISRSSNPDPRA